MESFLRIFLLKLGRITQDEYDKKAIELKERQRQINSELKIHDDADEQFAITLTSLISLASRAYEIFESSKIAKKRQLIAFMFLNLRMNGAKLRFDLKKSFNLMVNLNGHTEWLLGWDSKFSIITTNFLYHLFTQSNNFLK